MYAVMVTATLKKTQAFKLEINRPLRGATKGNKMKVKEGETIVSGGESWLVDNIFNTNDQGLTCLQVRALTKRNYSINKETGLGWQTAIWVEVAAV